MDLFGAVQGLGEERKCPTLPKTCHTYPTMIKLSKLIPYLKQTHKIYIVDVNIYCIVNYIVDVAISLNIGNCSISMKEVIINSILQGFDPKKTLFSVVQSCAKYLRKILKTLNISPSPKLQCCREAKTIQNQLKTKKKASAASTWF